MDDFLKQCFPGQVVQRQKLPGDGGHREYFRLKVGGAPYILMSSGKEDGSLKDFINIQEMLEKADLPVPHLFHQDLKEGLLVLEDLGDITLESIQKTDKRNSQSLYQEVLQNLVKMQSHVPLCDSFPRFGKDFFQEETELAVRRLEKLAQNCGKQKPPKDKILHFKEELERICEQLDKLTFVYCHRDFHSRNLMVKNRHTYWIDFQDGGQGPYCYDLCSLLYDSYVFFDGQEKKNMVDFYFQVLPDSMKQAVKGTDSIYFFTRLQFLQRGFKACGCFAGFYNDSRRITHLPCIPPTLKELEQEAVKLSYNRVAEYIQSLRERLDFSFLDDYPKKNIKGIFESDRYVIREEI